MKLTTTFWSKEIHTFDKLLFINGTTQKIVVEADLNNSFKTYLFFKEISKFVKSPEMLKTLNAETWTAKEDYYQFAVMRDNEICHIKWFDLIINENCVISHDIAFETTLIKKNGISLSFGHFPMYYYHKNENAQLPKYREFNIKSRAYKYMANQVKKSLF